MRKKERERERERESVLYRFVSHRQTLFSERTQRAFCSLRFLYDFYYQHLRSFYRRFLIHRDGDAPRHEERPIFHRLPTTVEVKIPHPRDDIRSTAISDWSSLPLSR